MLPRLVVLLVVTSQSAAPFLYTLFWSRPNAGRGAPGRRFQAER